MAQSFPGPLNVFLPAFQTTGDMVIAYSRHPNQFPLNEYVKLVPVDKMQGEYLFINPQQAIRFKDTSLSDYEWPDGQFRPGFQNLDPSNNLQFKFRPYICRRYNYFGMYGELTVQQADWNLTDEQVGQLATKAMVGRTLRAQDILSTQALAGNTVTATVASGPSGGFWSAGTISTPFIRKSIAYGAQLMLQQTAGALSYKDMVLIVNAKTAALMGNSDEVYHYISNQVTAPEIQRQAGNKLNFAWQLPGELSSIAIIVEDTQYNTNLIGSANEDVAQSAMPDNVAYLMARPGSLVSGGGKSFSTLMMPVYKKEEMLTEIMNDAFNKIIRCNVVDNFDVQLSAPETLVKFTNLFS